MTTTTGITQYTGAQGTNAYGQAPSTAGSSATGKDTFLQLLVSQMKNQDPTNPTDSQSYMAEYAQFSTVEQLQNLNQTTTTMAGLNQLSSVSSLIGKTVTTGLADSSGKPIGGVVTGLTTSNGVITLTVNGQQVQLDAVTGIQQTAS